MSKLRIGIIGAGNIARDHLRSYKQCDDVEVVAICDINEDVLNEKGDEFGIEKRFTSMEDMLANVELDAVSVCVWNCNHAKCTIAALNAGLHVLCEKPMSYTVEEAKEMVEVSKKTGKILMLGFVTRFTNDTIIAKDFVDKGILGDIYYGEATYLRRHGNPGGWFSDHSRSGGGPVIDLGVHAIDNIRYLMGSPKPVSVYAMTNNNIGPRHHLKTDVGWKPKGASAKDICDVEDFATALIRFDNYATILLRASYDMHDVSTNGKKLLGTKGGLKYGTSDAPTIYTEMCDYMVDVTPSINNLKAGKASFAAEIKHFVDCCLGKCECTATAEDGYVVMQILDAIYRSAETKHEVIIK